MARKLVSRRVALGVVCLPAVLAACTTVSGPVRYEPLSWAYLTPLKLDVATIDIRNDWTPAPGTLERGFLAPMTPVDALRRMAEDRLVAAGTSGRAVFIIQDASIVQQRESYVGHFAVRLEVSAGEGQRSGYAEAQVARTRTIEDDSPDGVRRELYEMVRQMMFDMNVEFEYQVRRSLGDYLQATTPVAPAPGPVEQQQLGPTAAEPEAPPAQSSGTTAPPVVPLLPPAPPPAAVPFSSPAPTPLSQ